MRRTISSLYGVLLLLLLPGTAHAGRGSSPSAIKSAIASDSVDAISSELERAEHLVCPSCVPMVRPLIDHPDVRVRQVAAWWLARRGLQGDLLESMSDRLAAADSTKARNAADVLGSIRARKAIAPLGTALHEPRFNAEARAAMAHALGAIGDPAATPALGAALTAAEATVRGAALESLRQLRGFEDPAIAVPLLGDGDANVRVEAIYTIAATRDAALRGSTGVSAAQKLVTLVSGDPNPVVRKKAAWALGEIGAPSSLAAAALGRAAQNDRDPLVRSLAHAALGKLGR